LSATAQEALLEIARTCDIRLDVLAERIGFSAGGDEGARDPRPPAEPGQGKTAPPVMHRLAVSPPARGPYLLLKRLADVVAAATLLLLLAPLIVCIGILAAIDVGLPVVFWQQRPGMRGERFK